MRMHLCIERVWWQYIYTHTHTQTYTHARPGRNGWREKGGDFFSVEDMAKIKWKEKETCAPLLAENKVRQLFCVTYGNNRTCILSSNEPDNHGGEFHYTTAAVCRGKEEGEKKYINGRQFCLLSLRKEEGRGLLLLFIFIIYSVIMISFYSAHNSFSIQLRWDLEVLRSES